MKNYYFTFGAEHPFRKYILCFEAQSEAVARQKMATHFHNNWCGCYPENEETLMMISKFNLQVVVGACSITN